MEHLRDDEYTMERAAAGMVGRRLEGLLRVDENGMYDLFEGG